MYRPTAAALRRAAARRDAGCAVKALEWRDHRPDSFPEPAWSAQTPFGFYNIEEVSASDSPAYVARLHAHHFIADKDSLDEAKAAAQADYEKRIRSALLEQPATPGYAAGFEACREALEFARRQLVQVKGGSTGAIPNAIVALIPEAIEKIDEAFSALPAQAPAAEVTAPRVSDNDRDEITVTLDGKELRGWSYSSDDERRTKMLCAREYVEGFCTGRRS